MKLFVQTQKQLIRLSLVIATFASFASQATIVQFETSFGNFEVNLYDETTPETVANFLEYVEDSAGNSKYSKVVIHRSIEDFIIQGGGFTYNEGVSLNANNLPLDNIVANTAVTNEPVYSNVRGTIAMAKLSGDPNSATSQWFINLADNSLNLDRQNGGFTVFGEVTGNGMDFIDQMVEVQTYTFGGAFTDIPLQDYDIANEPDDNNLIVISAINVTDPTVATAAGLNPPANIGPEVIPEPTSSSGGGALSLLILGLIGLNLRRKR